MDPNRGENMWHYHDGMGWWMIFGGIWMIVFWGVILAVIIWGVKQLTGRNGAQPNRPERQDPLEIAKERYAKGEISREEFEQIKKDIS